MPKALLKEICWTFARPISAFFIFSSFIKSYSPSQNESLPNHKFIEYEKTFCALNFVE